MSDLKFDIALRWTGTGTDGAGEIKGDDVDLELSTPKSMGGRGAGTNPEELLVSAVASCYAATLFSLLARSELPIDALELSARGTVEDFRRRGASFSSIAVSPRIIGGDEARRGEYEATAVLAHDHCLIGNTLRPEVSYVVGAVEIMEAPARTARKEPDPGWGVGV